MLEDIANNVERFFSHPMKRERINSTVLMNAQGKAQKNQGIAFGNHKIIQKIKESNIMIKHAINSALMEI